MFGGLFNSLYYGKAGKGDFNPDDLPKNRVALFFAMLRVRYGGIIKINLIYALFMIPTLAWIFINFSVMETLPEDELLQGYLTVFLTILIPCMVIAGPARAGMTYVLRNWARDQHSFAGSDFKDAMKANWKQGALVQLINGLVYLVVYVGYIYYGSMAATSSAFFTIPQVFVVIIGVFWLLMGHFLFPLMITYQLSFKQLLVNAAILTMARLPFSLLFGIGLLIPLVVLVLVPASPIFVMLYYIVIGYGLHQFIKVSYANASFDKYINPRIDGAPVNMGLRPDNLDDDEDDEDGEDSEKGD